jgi:hypothetical protein
MGAGTLDDRPATGAGDFLSAFEAGVEKPSLASDTEGDCPLELDLA